MSEKFKGYALNAATKQHQFIGAYNKPNLERDSVNSVKITASSTLPKFVVIGGAIHPITSTIRCHGNVTGVGGIAQGGGLTAKTAYYVYAVLSGGSVKLIMDSRAPSGDGPFGFSSWTYLGAVSTISTAGTFPEFRCCRGTILHEGPLQDEKTSSTSYAALTYKTLPVTARHAWVEIFSTGTEAAGYTINVSPTGTTASGPFAANCASTAAVSVFGWVLMITAQTLYVKVSNAAIFGNVQIYGWAEDLSEYP